MDDNSPQTAPDDRPGLGVVANVATPYRIHLHRRLAAEIPELKLHSFFTHGRADFNWRIEGMEAIGPIFLADPREDVRGAGRMTHWGRELRRAARIIDFVPICACSARMSCEASFI